MFHVSFGLFLASSKMIFIIEAEVEISQVT